MAKIGRNQPCPCDSGKKYKHCCLATDQAAAAATREEQRRNAPPPPAPRPMPRWAVVDDADHQLDRMSNDVVDLIDAGRFDEAERMCHRLLDQFPDLPDGHMRLGQLFRARGEPATAARHLRLAAAVARVGVADDDDDLLELPRSLEAEADSLDPPSP
jgi:predicted Zn-dependent protease